MKDRNFKNILGKVVGKKSEIEVEKKCWLENSLMWIHVFHLGEEVIRGKYTIYKKYNTINTPAIKFGTTNN